MLGPPQGCVSHPSQELGKYSQLKTSHLTLPLGHEQETPLHLLWGMVLDRHRWRLTSCTYSRGGATSSSLPRSCPTPVARPKEQEGKWGSTAGQP